MKKDKIKALLMLKGHRNKDYYEYLGITRQALYHKEKKDMYSADDLIKLAELTNTRLAFVDRDNTVIFSFDANDVNK